MTRPIRRLLAGVAMLMVAASAPVTATGAQAPSGPGANAPQRILFVGNSFTYGAHSPVRAYRPDLVTDLNGDGVGGVPALFKTFADEAHLAYVVSLETDGGKDLRFHYDERQRQLSGTYDVVILQGLSTLANRPQGDPTLHVEYAGRLAAMFRRRNPRTVVDLVSTWSRADLTYKPGSPWSGKPITQMALDLRAANDTALARYKDITAQIPVGEAWNRAFADGVADPDPYDGTAFGQVDLWTYDQFHASAAGYYLEALMIFGRVTGVDPVSLGEREKAADALGLSPQLTLELQAVASKQLHVSG